MMIIATYLSTKCIERQSKINGQYPYLFFRKYHALEKRGGLYTSFSKTV